MRISLKNRVEDLPRLERALSAFAQDHGIPEPELLGINLVLEELFTNVIFHAHDDGAEHEVQIHVALDGRDLRIEVSDDGRPFDPREAPRPDLNAPLDEREIGGLGLHLVRESVDALDYRREGDRNVTTLVKKSVPG